MGHLRLLRGIRHRMEGSADWERTFLAARMNIDDDSAKRENSGFDEVGNAVRNGASRIAREGPIHVDAIKRGDAGVGDAGALA